MAGKAYFQAGLVLAVGLMSVTPVTAARAQAAAEAPGNGQAEAEADDDDQGAQLAQAIGCVAAYDTILSQVHDGKVRNRKLPAIQAARAAALDFFRDGSEMSDAEVAAEIAQADSLFPSVLRDSHESLADYKADCDAAFAPDPFADTLKSTL
ncbi:MAG: hypothetical protein ACXU8O_06545 [Asticcacaulis sp.]